MSQPCPRRDEILAPPALRRSPAEELQAHLEGCAECQAAAAGLIGIRGELAEHAPVPRPGVEARILAELRTAAALDPTERPPLSRRLFLGLGLGLTAAALALLLLTPPPHAAVVSGGSLASLADPAAPLLAMNDAVPLSTPVLARAPARITTALSRLALSEGSELQLRSRTEGRRAVVEEVHLATGRVHAEVAPLRGERTFSVRTAEATVTVVGTAFSVERADGRTVVEVEHGVVRAAGRDGGLLRELRAGDRAVFPPEAPEASTDAGEESAEPRAQGGPETAEASSVDPDTIAELADRARARRRGHGRQRSRPSRSAPPRIAPAPTPAIPEPTSSPALSPPPSRVAESDRPRAQRRTLAEARRALRQTPSAAVDLARGILEQAPSEEIEAEALAVMADGFRRGGRLEEAASTYARVARHPAGQGLAEESLLQLALLRERQGLRPAALSALSEAGRRFPTGMLAPERTALSVELLEGEGRLPESVALLLASEPLHSPELERLRIRLAEAVAATRPQQARRLLEATRLESLSAAWDNRHAALLGRLESGR